MTVETIKDNDDHVENDEDEGQFKESDQRTKEASGICSFLHGAWTEKVWHRILKVMCGIK